ncbi:MAG: PilZ domain-containing protein [Acidobacteriales bacterium]|nr:PilZ domain-containing protein [Terriglobales bacterium]
MSNTPAGRVPWPDSFDEVAVSSERRKHARTKLADASAVVLDANLRPATVVDLSEGGVGVRSDAVLEQGATCRLQFSVPDSNQVIDAACELAWKRAAHAGFRFTILTEKSLRQIKEWLKGVGTNGHGSAAVVSPQPEPLEVVAEEERFSATDEALLNLAIKARDFTHADGVAIAVADGEGMICRASLGTAPDTGVRIQSDRGLSGECLRTGEIVACYDSETDARVDSAVARELNMRSAVIVPIGRHEAPAGLLEVFFSSTGAFDEATVYALQELASGFFVASLKQQPAPAEEPATVPPPTGLPQMASFSQREAPPGFVICDVCGRENNESNQVCDGCDVPLPAALRYVDLNSPEESTRSGVCRERTLVDRSEAPGRSHRKKIFFMLAVVVILALWQARGKISADTHIPSAPPSVIKLEVEDNKPPLPDKPLVAPVPATTPKELATKKSTQPAEPEVTVTKFPLRAKQTRAKSTTSPASSTQAANIGEGTATTPHAHAANTTSEVEQALTADQPIVLPLDDQDVVSAVSTPPPAPAKPKQPSLWKRIGKRLILQSTKPEEQKKQ